MAMTVNHNLYKSYMVQNRDAGVKREEDNRQTDGVKSGRTKEEFSEPKLSDAAEKLLKKLRGTYGNMDFMVADFRNEEEAKEALSRGTKEVSVLFSTEELEKMASDEKYEKEYMDRVRGAMHMSEEINRQFGFESAFGKDAKTNEMNSEITRIGISFNSDGTTSFFAELEEISESRREHIKKLQEERLAKKQEDDKNTGNKKQTEDKDWTEYPEIKPDKNAKHTIVRARSQEELIKKIREVDWKTIRTENEPEAGRKFDFSI